MVDKQKLLDEVMRREKTKVFRRIMKYGAFVLVFGAIYTFAEFKNFDRVKFSKSFDGVVLSVETSTTRDNKMQIMYAVKLDNEKTVNIAKMDDISVKKGDVIEVLREELESGRLQYSIVSFDQLSEKN